MRQEDVLLAIVNWLRDNRCAIPPPGQPGPDHPPSAGPVQRSQRPTAALQPPRSLVWRAPTGAAARASHAVLLWGALPRALWHNSVCISYMAEFPLRNIPLYIRLRI